jgi:C4-dicarboxylate-specific signal transduction histidine kinase
MEAATALHALVQMRAAVAIDATKDTAPQVFVVVNDTTMRDSLELLVRSAGWPIQIFNSLQDLLISRVAGFDRAGTRDVACKPRSDCHSVEGCLDGVDGDAARASKSSALSAITASIAHEVNQPLSGILTNACACLRLLDASPPNIDAARETARRAIRDSNRASDIVTRLRAMFNKGERTVELMDFNEGVREVLDLSLIDLQRSRVAVVTQLDEALPTVIGDRVQLQQVMLNLIRNASDSMSEVHDRSRQLVIKTNRESRDSVRLTVRDSGIGVSPDSLDSLFDPFYTTKNDGMGVGLFVSRAIIERHRGRIWAEPNRGAPGATFAFSIPCMGNGCLNS